jgi:hypothetical protein
MASDGSILSSLRRQRHGIFHIVATCRARGVDERSYNLVRHQSMQGDSFESLRETRRRRRPLSGGHNDKAPLLAHLARMREEASAQLERLEQQNSLTHRACTFLVVVACVGVVAVAQLGPSRVVSWFWTS